MICVNFVKTLWLIVQKFWRHLLPSSLLDELSIDERDSDRFISRLVVCRSSDSSCDSSLLTVD
jgi:hypothetical protein